MTMNNKEEKNMIKRILALLTALAMLLGCAAAETAPEAVKGTHQIEMKAVPLYLENPDTLWPEDFPVYFVDGVEDLPFVELNDWAKLIEWHFTTNGGPQYAGYSIDVRVLEDENQVVFLRDNVSVMLFDFGEGTIMWSDYLEFLRGAQGPYMEMLGIPPTNENGQVNLFALTSARDRMGNSTTVDLARYEIPMIKQDGRYLLPLQTLASLTFALLYHNVYFNGKCLIFANGMNLTPPTQNLQNELMNLITPEILQAASQYADTQEQALTVALQLVTQTEEGAAIIAKYQEQYNSSIYKIYVDAERGERSKTLAEFGYHELCMELDAFYGQQSEHHISSFESFFDQTGLTIPLLTGTVEEADDAVQSLVANWLDDNHTAYLCGSYLATPGRINAEAAVGYSSRQLRGYIALLSQKRMEHPEAMPWYYEVDDTAYIRLDAFKMDEHLDYYEADAKGELPDPTTDTLSLVIQAHRQITREDSPIKNVVLDLSTNHGGMTTAAIYVLSWFLGESQVSIHNTFTNAESTMSYRADVNLDHQLDDSDTITHLNLFCLTSPHAFSCGNLVPWAFKADGRVTLIGKVTGGGACALIPMTTAWGTTFTISSPMLISFVKNGAYYSVDQGAEPDFFIRDFDNFYDRNALTEIIHGLH